MTPTEAFNTVKEARDQIQEGGQPEINETTTTAVGIVILVFLFIMLGIAMIHTVYLVVKGQWWKVVDFFTPVKEVTDEKIIQQEKNTVIYVLETVKRERDKIKKMLAEKHGGKNVSKNSRKSLIGAKGLDDGGGSRKSDITAFVPEKLTNAKENNSKQPAKDDEYEI
jgi:hypothetical protein